MPDKLENISIRGIVMGALAGAVLGAIMSVILMTVRSSDQQERATPGISNYLRLGMAMFMLVRQTSELILHQPKQA